MTSVDYSDQLDIFDPEDFSWPVHLVGLGGIGSSVLFPLLKLGIKTLHLWDDDVVEPRNIPAQLVYRPRDNGKYKVDAAKAFAKRQQAECSITVHRTHVGPDTELEGIVICGVDSMASRNNIWEAIKFNTFVPLFMDGRIGGEHLQLLTLNPSDSDNIERYQEFLFPDSEASELPCAARTVIHPPVILAGLMIANLTLFAREERPQFHVMASARTFQFYPTL